jgi:hypothetical protein
MGAGGIKRAKPIRVYAYESTIAKKDSLISDFNKNVNLAGRYLILFNSLLVWC